MAGVNLIGFASANIGLGIAARNTARLLVSAGYDVSIADLKLDAGRSDQDHDLDHLMVSGTAHLKHPVTLFHLNPPLLGKIRKEFAAQLTESASVCVPFWELPVLPPFWIADLLPMEVVLCPSRFIGNAVRDGMGAAAPAIVHYPQTAFLPENHRADRARFALPEQGTLFIASFDLSSDIFRKNPWAAIEAFTAAFGPDDDVRLVIKVNNSHLPSAPAEQLARLRKHAAADRRILVRDERLSYEEIISLYESCDVYVSLHRSEGLGLGLMEAMLLKKPVIATAWSGNMDFMNDENSCLVDYTLVPVESPLYRSMLSGGSALWADPVIERAAAWMRTLHENPELRGEKGDAARTAMTARQHVCEQGKVFETMISVLNAPITDQARLFARISALLKSNEAARALALYDLSRPAIPAGSVTPELARFDTLMARVRAARPQ
ncbi:MAG: glycosyltransferase family 4 protein [Chitinispirillaceae bacterium]|nr:glycosyltransferase family 4 protein [Chitinispirillaceae bacterium]